MWLPHTSIGDQVETERHTVSGRWRWRLTKIRMPGESRFDDWDDDRPWSAEPIPDNLKPGWMK